jgi:Tol biopolymer transport system component
MIDPETGEESRLTYSGEGMNSNIPQWSPDGTRIAFASNRDDDAGRSSIYVMDGDGTNVRRLTPVGSSDYFPQWSPDGKKIAFMRSSDGDAEIYVMEPDGSDVVRLTDNDAFDVAYFWSPNGEQLLFTSDREGTGTIYVMEFDGSEVRAIGAGSTGGWADDESHVWYLDYPRSLESGAPCYGVMDLEGTVVEEWCGRGLYPSFRHGMCYSTDGTEVAFVAIPDDEIGFPVTEDQMEKFEVYVADADGSNVRRLTHNDSYDGHCSW